MKSPIIISLTFIILLLITIVPSIQISNAQEPICIPYITIYPSTSDFFYDYNYYPGPGRFSQSNLQILLDENVPLTITTIPFYTQGEHNPYTLYQAFPSHRGQPKLTISEEESNIGSDASLPAYTRIYNSTITYKERPDPMRLETITTNKTVVGIEIFTVNYPYENAGLRFTFQSDPSIFDYYLQAVFGTLNSFAPNNGSCDNF